MDYRGIFGTKKHRYRDFHTTLLMLAGIILLRLIFLNIPILVDPSDARYAHMAEHMLLNNSWLSPMVHNGNQLEPYWSKPPLGFWAMAASMSAFGESVFAARLPAFFATAITTLLIYLFCLRLSRSSHALQACVMYFSTPFIFIMAGSTLVDPVLALFVSGAIVAYGLVLLQKTSNPKVWLVVGYSFLGMGVLTKGPIAILIPGLAICAYIILTRNIGDLWKLRPFWGALAILIVVAPWFISMEVTHPGFLHYFFIEENLNRLISSDLKLKSGSGHKTIPGFALLTLPLISSPWIVCLFFNDTKERYLRLAKDKLKTNEYKFVVSWIMAPIIFLALGKQVLIYYLLPIIPGVICLIALWIRDTQDTTTNSLEKISKYIYYVTCVFSILISLGVLIYEHFEHIETLPTVTALTSAFLILVLLIGQSIRLGFSSFFRAGTALVVSVLSLSAATTEPLAEYNSSAALFMYISSSTSTTLPKRVSFLYEAPPSSYFYSLRLWGTEQPVETISIDNFKNEIKGGILVSRDKNFKKLPQFIQKLPSKRVGKWFVQEVSESVLQEFKNE